ncbi:vWA domain-containing protein [Mycolicibacterium hodleri]|uniref:VWA domain-containing protein n=1 Tax=Mycolicibacterium hodleri TaxID=49897 RepID=A0A502DL97_9MYCO|nr:VWA domain-containing protein [Mycolicibacterium hodleri]TPG25562.1 VWA domain-containing protein [Mycolicibacterium hodleri]
MNFQPVFPPLVLMGIAAIILVARISVLRRSLAAARTRAALWRWCGMTLAALLLIVAASRPVIDPDRTSATRVADREAPNVFLVVDRSPDMRVVDYPRGLSRMDLAREDLTALIDRYPGARVAMISFASRPNLDWPLSPDTRSLRPLVSTFEPYAAAPDALDQTNAGAAGNMLRYQLIGAKQQYPRAKTLVYYLGAGAAEAELPPRDFNLPDDGVDGGAVLGYGTAAGGPIPGTAVARSRLGEPSLRVVADQIGVPYTSRSDAEPLDSTGETVDGATAPSTAVDSSGRTELYWAPAILAEILILVELYLVLREFRRTRLLSGNVVT